MAELSQNALKIFNDLYCLSNENVDDAFLRVANEFSKNEADKELAFKLLDESIWRPNTPVWLNAGSNHKIYSACFVVSLEDSMDGIYDVANVARRTFQHGAGIGIPIGNLREKEADIYEGDRSKSPDGKSSGPICFMQLYDAVGETTKSGGRVRRAAILCSMPIDHPDILDYIKCKEIDGTLANMNISVNVTDSFMKALDDGVTFDLISPSTKKKVKTVNASDVWEQFIDMNWKTADPGILFIDNINKFNPLKSISTIDATNPCGEQPLMGYGCCNLSAININKFVVDGEMLWDKLYNTTFDVMELMDNIIDNMEFPDDRFKENTLKYRHVGIGPMGLADAMFALDIKYDSAKGKQFASKVMETMTTACLHKSALLAKDRGKLFGYDNIKDDIEEVVFTFTNNEEVKQLIRDNGLRNIQHTTCQPTGSTALSADTSYGIEPCFGLVFKKNMMSGETMIVANPIFERRFKNEEWYTSDLLTKIFNNGGTLKNLRGIPKEVREVFVTAHDIKPKDRIDVQAALQKYCSTSISSTINLSKDTTKEEISELYKYAYKKGLKGVTIYRDGSKKNQPVSFTDEKPGKGKKVEIPDSLPGRRWKIKTGNGDLYIIVSYMEEKPVEVFLQLGKSGQVMNTMTESLGRVISLALQSGVPVTNVVKTLIDINSDKPVWTRLESTDSKPVQILSIPDAIAQLLNRFYGNINREVTSLTEKCPECGLPVMLIEGCSNCTCGWSKCG